MLYFLTGLGSGAANVPMMSLVAAWFGSRARGRAAGFIVSGSGFAILLTGWLVPLLNQRQGAAGWRSSWLVIAAVILCVAAINAVILRDRPADLGLTPHGGEAASYAAAGAPPARHRRRAAPRGALVSRAALFPVRVHLRHRGDLHGHLAGARPGFPGVGRGHLLVGRRRIEPVLGTDLRDALRSPRAPGRAAIVFGLQSLAYALFAADLPGWSLVLAVGCYGLTVWSVPSIMTAVAADLAGPQNAAAAFGFITFIFGLGQMAGPVAAGALAEVSGRFASSFALAAGLAGLAAILSLRLRVTHRG